MGQVSERVVEEVEHVPMVKEKVFGKKGQISWWTQRDQQLIVPCFAVEVEGAIEALSYPTDLALQGNQYCFIYANRQLT